MPRIPDWLDAEGRKIWRGHAGKLFRAGLISEIDGLLLGAVYQTASDLMKVHRLIESAAKLSLEKARELGKDTATAEDMAIFMKVSDGGTLLSKRNQQITQLCSLGRQFGMSSSARSGIQALPVPTDTNDPWDKL